jgi:putative beta-barrel porin BBP2
MQNLIRRLSLVLLAVAIVLPARAEEAAAEGPTPISFDSPSYHRRPYMVSVLLREEYDTNIFTTELDPQESFKTIIEPTLALNIYNARSFLGARYRNSSTYYHSRQGDPWDIAHYLDFALNHEFNTRLSIDVTDNFRHAQEPEVTQESAFIRREGSYDQNSFHAGASYYITRRLFWNVGFGHDWWEYEDPFFSFVLDRTSVTGSTGLNYVVSPVTTASLNYQYIVTDYRKIARDSDSHIIYAGLQQTFIPEWSVNIQGGVQHRKTEGADADVAPFASIESNWNFLPTSVFSVGYNTSLQDTDQVSFNFSQTQHIYANINARLTYDLTLNVGGDYILNDYPANQGVPGSTDAQETTLVYHIGLSYRFTPQWSGELAYSYTTVDSDFFGSSYNRHLMSIGTRFTY